MKSRFTFGIPRGGVFSLLLLLCLFPLAGRAAADYSGQDLSGMDLTGLDLVGANFSYANLSGASLLGQNLEGANFTGADLRGADLAGTAGAYTLRNTIMADGVFSGIYGGGLIQVRKNAIEAAIEGTSGSSTNWAIFGSGRVSVEAGGVLNMRRSASGSGAAFTFNSGGVLEFGVGADGAGKVVLNDNNSYMSFGDGSIIRIILDDSVVYNAGDEFLLIDLQTSYLQNFPKAQIEILMGGEDVSAHWLIDYRNGQESDLFGNTFYDYGQIYLVAVPEPAAAAALFALIAMAAAVWIKRR